MTHMKFGRKSMIGMLIVLSVAMLAMGIAFIRNEALVASAENSGSQTETLAVNAYEFADNDGYTFASDKKVPTYSNGMTALGTLSVTGASLTKTSYNGVQAIGVNSGTTLTFTYKQSVGTKNHDGKEWKLSSDSATSINNFAIGTIGNGAIIVLKSSDGKNWISSGAKMVGINNSTFNFSPDGADVGKGTYYRFLSAAEIYYTTSHTYRTWYTLWIGTKTEYTNHYTNLGQESIVYVCPNSALISFSSKATSEYKITNENLTKEEISFLQKGTTLVDGSVSFSSVTVDNLGNSCYSTSYSYNDSEYKTFTDSKKIFSAAGVYNVKVKTPLGTEKVTRFYIVNAGDDLAYSQYFGEGLVDSTMRIYDSTKAVPVYMLGKKFTISPSAHLPGLYGSVYYFKDDAALKENNYSVEYTFAGQKGYFSRSFDKEGYYILDLFSSDPTITSGEIVNYSFRLYIKDDKNYAPTVNYNLLTSSSRNVSFVRKVYAVTLKTAGGGSFVYCFPYDEAFYDMAYEVAENIELLSVEDYGSYYYYKSQTSNTKEKYTTKTKLFAAIRDFAKQNVCTLYLEANTEYLTHAAAEDVLKDLTSQSIRKDTCVVVNEYVKKALQATEIYVNDYKFVRVADYESDVVMALDELGNQYRVPYGKTLGELFTTTQFISITEENWHSRNTYKVIYYAPNENKGAIKLKISGKNTTVTSDNASEIKLVGEMVSIVDGGDQYDSQSMVIISNAKGEREVMLLSEVAGYAFANKNMEYEITIVNRFGTAYSFNLIVQEKTGILFNIEENNLGMVSKNDAYTINSSGNMELMGFDISDDKKDFNSEEKSISIDTNAVDKNEGLSAGAIVGISIGSVVGLVIIAGIVFLFIRKRMI